MGLFPLLITQMAASLSSQKITQALAFFAHQEGGEINRMKAFKLLFFADRYHLRKYGRPVSGAHYVAMKNGPVASEAKDIALMVGLTDAEIGYAQQFITPTSKNNYGSLVEPDCSVFSESDLEAMNFSWKKFGKLAEFQLSKLTHFYPEWSKHEDILKFSLSARMDYTDFFLDPIKPNDPCHPLTKDERITAIELFQKQQLFEQFWK